MNTPMAILIALSMLSLLAVMILGIIAMVKGGEFNRQYGNRLMRARLMLQGMTIALLLLAFFTAK